MKPLLLATGIVVASSACRPSVGPPISAIEGPAILAVVAEPAEVDQAAIDTTVRYEALAVDASGALPNADIPTPLLWATCTQPKPPTENNSVSSVCLSETLFPGAIGPTSTSYVAPLPPDPCSLFGPKVPPATADQPPIRPRDPDVTNGYYVPIRVELIVPESLRRAGMSSSDVLMSFHMQRIQCGLANAPGDIVRRYNQSYKLNNNPKLASLTVESAGQVPVVLPATRSASTIPAVTGQPLSLTAAWSAESVESYPAWDVLKQELAPRRESMRLSWYATDGTFEHDVTGRGENETETFVHNTWKPGANGLVHLWLVLHDIRGGTDFAAYDIQVGP